MTTTTAVLLPVQPGKVRNAIMNALGRHGVSHSTAESIWLDLTTGQDPRPADMPETVIYRGIKVDWPKGRHTRALSAHEVKSINRALRSVPVRSDQLLDMEDNADAGRHAVQWLYLHKSHADYNPELVRAEELRELVEEATVQRRIDNEPILQSLLCWSASKGGKLCLLDTEHEGRHKNGKAHWANVPSESITCPFEREQCLDMQGNGEGACDEHPMPTREELLAERTNVQILTTEEHTVDAQIVPLEQASDHMSEIDRLLADIKALREGK